MSPPPEAPAPTRVGLCHQKGTRSVRRRGDWQLKRRCSATPHHRPTTRHRSGSETTVASRASARSKYVLSPSRLFSGSETPQASPCPAASAARKGGFGADRSYDKAHDFESLVSDLSHRALGLDSGITGQDCGGTSSAT